MFKQSPLIELAADTPIVDLASIKITEKPFYNQFILRGLASDANLFDAVKTMLSVKLPVEANTMVESNGFSVCWMSPDQWLIISENEDHKKNISMLAGALENMYASINDVSSGQTIINISGENSLKVMSKGTTLDVHPQALKPGDCAQAVFAKMNVLIFPRHSNDNNEFDIVVRRSFADFLGRWLINACTEYKG